MGNDSKQTPIMTWSDRIDQLVNYCKWPMAIFTLVLTPALVWSSLQLVSRIIANPSWSLFPCIAGVATFVFLWRRWLGRLAIGRWLVTMEHEITHAIFAVLTGHKIVSIRATMGHGGEVRYEGRGNWLITAAPYFFPTAALVLSLVAYILPFAGLPWPSFLLGIALGYHFVSTYRETHRDQSDLKELSTLFCWMFLPAANIAIIAFLIAYAHNGSEGVSTWIADTRQPISSVMVWLQSFPGAYVPG
jgi:hypothetical protein